jgi:hypothetical protein
VISATISADFRRTAVRFLNPTRRMPVSIRISIPLFLVLLSACSTSPISRIDADRAQYESWPLDVQDAILKGEAKKGMTREQVTMALGKPSQVESRSAKAGDDEVWIYRKGGSVGSSLLNNAGVSIGGGLGGVNVGTGLPGGRRSSTEEHEVVFANDVVVRSDTDG